MLVQEVGAMPELHEPIWYGDLILDPKQQIVFCKNEALRFTDKEFAILFYMASCVPKQEYVTKSEIYAHLYKDAVEPPGEGVLYVFIFNIRRKLKKSGSVCSLDTIYKKGYQLCLDLPHENS